MPLTASDGLQVSFATPVPTRGLMDGVDPALVSWDEEFTPDAENCRFSSGLWQTRLGYAAFKTLPGAGSVRWLADLYQSNGAITRLAAQGSGATAQLYEKKEGTDTEFVAATGGSGLGGTSQNLFQGVIHADQLYFTDRAGALRKFKPANYTPQNTHVVTVAQPAAPVAAPGATPQAWNSHQLDWGGGNWTDSNAGTFPDTDDTTNNPPPPPCFQTRLLGMGASSRGETITHSTPATNLNSHTLAFWVRQDVLKATVQFDFGLLSPTDYGIKLRDNAQVADEWYPIFMEIGDIQTANYIRFRALTQHSGVNIWVTNIIQPGRLEGEYRWIYTHYDSTNGRESPPSTPSNGGQPLDFSAVGVSWQPTSSRAFSKACALRFTSDSGVDSSTDKMRVYRSGGVPSLTIDESTGQDLWLRVAEIPDYASTLTQQENAGSGLLHVVTTTGLAIGMTVVVDPGTVGKEEYFRITGVAPTVLNVSSDNGGANGVSLYTHLNGATVRIAYIDNVANEQIDVTLPIDIRRDNPPTAARFVVRSPEGRLVLLNYIDAASNKHPTGIAWSNKPTPDRPHDYEVFPDGVDPLTTGSLTQGWRVDYTGDVAADEEIVWGGYYRDILHFLTRRAMYRVHANSQSDWGPIAITKVHNTGAVAGDTVQEAYGTLYWVADGPRVVRWTGSAEEPESISDLRVNARLKAAPQSLWGQWLAGVNTQTDGHYYKLWYTPSGSTSNVESLQFNIDRNSWEAVRYYDANANPIGYQAIAVRAGNTDSPDLYAVDTSGHIIQTEVGSLDGTVPIKVRFSTNKIPLVQSHPYWTRFLYNSLVHSLLIRLSAVTDTATLNLTTGGSEYGLTSHDYPINLDGTGDHEIKVRAHRTLVGRWLQITITGSFSNRPGFRDLTFYYIPWRSGRISKNAP